MKYNKYYVYALFTMTFCLTVSDNLHSNNQKNILYSNSEKKTQLKTPKPAYFYHAGIGGRLNFQILLTYLIVSNIFQVFSKARGGIAHVAVVFFDEQEWKNSRWTTSLLSLRKAGVRVLLVGVGPSFNYTSLRSLVENDRGVIIIDSYFELLRNSVELANTTCVATGQFWPLILPHFQKKQKEKLFTHKQFTCMVGRIPSLNLSIYIFLQTRRITKDK